MTSHHSGGYSACKRPNPAPEETAAKMATDRGGERIPSPAEHDRRRRWETPGEVETTPQAIERHLAIMGGHVKPPRQALATVYCPQAVDLVVAVSDAICRFFPDAVVVQTGDGHIHWAEKGSDL